MLLIAGPPLSRQAKDLPDGLDRARFPHAITRQLGDRVVEFLAPYDGQNALHGRMLEQLAAAEEDVVFGEQEDEIQPDVSGELSG